MNQKIALLEQRVSNLWSPTNPAIISQLTSVWGDIPAKVGTSTLLPGEKEKDLLKQQNIIQEKLTELAKNEAEVYRVAFDKEKELTDRALKLS